MKLSPRKPVLLLSALVLASSAAQAQSLEILGTGRAMDITTDGTKVLGGLVDGGSANDVWIWSDTGGAGTYNYIGGADPRAMSFDGSTVLGGGDATGNYEAMLWSAGSGWTPMGGAGPDCQGVISRPQDLTWSGFEAVGTANNGCLSGFGFKWTLGSGMAQLSTLLGSAQPLVISGVGNAIGGYDASGFNIKKASLWYPDGTQKLILAGVAPNNGGQGEVRGLSSDGIYAVGGAEWVSGLGAFRWDAVNGPEYLGELPGFVGAMGEAVSEDGKVIVGNSGAYGAPEKGWIWTEQDGMRSVEDVAASLGLAFPAGAVVSYVGDVSIDGRKVVGAFHTGFGTAETGFILNLPPASAPCGFTEYGAGAAPANVLALTGSGSTDVGTTPMIETTGASSLNVILALSVAQGSLALADGMLLLDASQIVATLKVPVVAGTAVLPLPLPNDPNLGGASLFLQALSFDPTQAGWLAFSNGLELTICP